MNHQVLDHNPVSNSRQKIELRHLKKNTPTHPVSLKTPCVSIKHRNKDQPEPHQSRILVNAHHCSSKHLTFLTPHDCSVCIPLCRLNTDSLKLANIHWCIWADKFFWTHRSGVCPSTRVSSSEKSFIIITNGKVQTTGKKKVLHVLS